MYQRIQFNLVQFDRQSLFDSCPTFVSRSCEFSYTTKYACIRIFARIATVLFKINTENEKKISLGIVVVMQ